MGSLQYRFHCVLGELGRFREETGFREPKVVPGFDMFRWVLTGSGFGMVRGFDGFRPGFDEF